MSIEYTWPREFQLDVDYGFLSHHTPNAPRQHNPRVVVNDEDGSVLRAIRTELARCASFTFSVAFVSPAAIALLKQDLVDFQGAGRIVTSDYLGFNSPAAFEELRGLENLGIDVRLHQAPGFHAKGYVFEHVGSVTAMLGSSNLTPSALLRNHEWNLKVSATRDSDLAAQLSALLQQQLIDSTPITAEWIEQYARTYVRPSVRPPRVPRDASGLIASPDILPERGAAISPPAGPTTLVQPNAMQQAALDALAAVRASGEKRAIVISATGTGKTILSALDVRAVAPRRLLFVVHREQILDRTIAEYHRVLGGSMADFGKLTGSAKDVHARYLFATVQTLSQPEVLAMFPADVFDYVIVDEAHRAGAASHRRLLDHFDPVFMLGMTATPERTDGRNVFELFDYNVPYEIRLTHALEEDMLAPFHYYGISDAAFDDGTTIDAESNLGRLVSPERVAHLVWALETYGQAGVPPRGLVFCSRKDEAHALSAALNGSALRGKPLRTVALTGDDSIAVREAAVERFESGELDYILTVDVFNEGVDIPTVNQVVMLRQTASAIVFVQQLGRGLRKSPRKDYLVVIDFIGNYANNFLIPVALFGDDSLNKESLRKNLIAAEEAGALPGLSSVHFDKIAQERVLRSIRDTKLDDYTRLKGAILAMRNRVGSAPKLWDFFRFESVDPVLLATKREHYPALVERVLKVEPDLSARASAALRQLSHEVLPAKRAHEFLLLRELLLEGRTTLDLMHARLASAQVPATVRQIESAIDSLTLTGYAEVDLKRYGQAVATREHGGQVVLDPEVFAEYRRGARFTDEVDDLIETGLAIVRKNYDPTTPFTVGRQYSRKEAMRLLGMPRKWASTVYGYKVDLERKVCPIFVTLHKSDDISASTAYEDALLDPSSALWYTRSRLRLDSPEVKPIVRNDVDLHLFVKKDDAEGAGSYYLGQPTSTNAEQTMMRSPSGASWSVVRMILRFPTPLQTALFDYFHPTVTDGR
jgi:superfamily II DNA or RNA helicase/HKD family nuclease